MLRTETFSCYCTQGLIWVFIDRCCTHTHTHTHIRAEISLETLDLDVLNMFLSLPLISARYDANQRHALVAATLQTIQRAPLSETALHAFSTFVISQQTGNGCLNNVDV